MMNVIDCEIENGLRVLSVDWPQGYTPSRVSAASRTIDPMERVDRLSENSSSLSRRIERLEKKSSISSPDNGVLDEAEAGIQEASGIDEDELVSRVLSLGGQNCAAKSKTIEALESAGMSREEARESLEEDLLVDRILKRGGK